MQEFKYEELSAIVLEQNKKIEQLQKEIQKISIAVFSNSLGKAKKLQRIIELAEFNREITITIIKKEFSISSNDYARKLLQEAASTSDLHFFKGRPGQESFVTRFRVENKTMNAYAEVYRELQEKPIGTTITESAIAHRYELSGQELHSVIGHLARHSELHVVLPMSRKGVRRVKRVR